jgi:hypothetical protein
MSLFGAIKYGGPTDNTIEVAFASYAEAVAGVPLYPVLVPQNAPLPAIAYQVVSDQQTIYHTGKSDFYKIRFQLSVVGASYKDAVSLRDFLRNELDGFTGIMAGIKQVFRSSTSISDDWADLHELPIARLEVSINYR